MRIALIKKMLMLVENYVPFVEHYYRNIVVNNNNHSFFVCIKKSVHKNCFEVNCKWSSGLLSIGVRV